MIAESSLRSEFVEGNERASGEKVTALVPRVEKPGDTSGPSIDLAQPIGYAYSQRAVRPLDR